MSNLIRRRILASSVLGLSVAAAGLFGVANSFAQASASASTSASTSEAPAANPTEASSPAPVAPPAVVNGPKVLMKTSMGDILVQLDADKAPKSVANFIQYVNKKHYKGTVFHRVIDGFMIQGGGFDAGMKQKPTAAPIQNEAKNGLKNETYTIAMARTGFPHSATSQFFINVNNNSPLDYPSRDGWGYCVFGKVVQGMEVVDAIAKVNTTTVGQFENVPKKPIVINSVSVVK